MDDIKLFARKKKNIIDDLQSLKFQQQNWNGILDREMHKISKEQRKTCSDK